MLKAVLYFKEGAQGWSEVYHTNHEEVADFCGAGNNSFEPETPVGLFIAARKELMAPACVINHVRVSKVGSPGNMDSDDYSDEEGAGTYPVGAVLGAVEVPICLLIQPQSGTLRRKRTYLGGIPHTIVKPPMTYVPNGTFGPRFSAFSAILRNNTFIIPGRPARNPATEKLITSFEVSADGKTADLAPNIRPDAAPAYWYVLIRGLKNPRGWNGIHRASSTAISQTMKIGPAKKSGVSTPAFVAGNQATVTLMVAGSYIINDVDIVGVAKHDRGRPFGVPRGRRD